MQLRWSSIRCQAVPATAFLAQRDVDEVHRQIFTEMRQLRTEILTISAFLTVRWRSEGTPSCTRCKFSSFCSSADCSLPIWLSNSSPAIKLFHLHISERDIICPHTIIRIIADFCVHFPDCYQSFILTHCWRQPSQQFQTLHALHSPQSCFLVQQKLIIRHMYNKTDKVHIT